jgi:hypothetical protein
VYRIKVVMALEVEIPLLKVLKKKEIDESKWEKKSI